MKKLFIILILVYILFGTDFINIVKNEIKQTTHQQYCYDYYKGRNNLLQECLNK